MIERERELSWRTNDLNFTLGRQLATRSPHHGELLNIISQHSCQINLIVAEGWVKTKKECNIVSSQKDYNAEKWI